MHLALDLKQYVVSRVSSNSKPTHPQAPPYDVGSIATNPHMAIILVHVGKNVVEDVLLDGGSSVNIIIEDLMEKKLPILKPTPYTLRMANQTNRVNTRSENPYPWYFVYRHLHNDEKQCTRC
jgi:hypothetical protein